MCGCSDRASELKCIQPRARVRCARAHLGHAGVHVRARVGKSKPARMCVRVCVCMRKCMRVRACARAHLGEQLAVVVDADAEVGGAPRSRVGRRLVGGAADDVEGERRLGASQLRTHEGHVRGVSRGSHACAVCSSCVSDAD